MDSTPTNQPNPFHKPDTYGNAETQSFNIDALGPDHPEIQERERQRREHLQKSNLASQDDNARRAQ